MTLLEYAEKTSPVPLTAWQREILIEYQKAREKGEYFICTPPRSGKVMLKKIIDEYYGEQEKVEVYCKGTKKIGIPCKRYLGKVQGKAELLCPICKTVNVVEDGEIKTREKEGTK